MHPHQGFYVVIEGIDGVGKGTVIESIIEYLRSLDKKIYDTEEFEVDQKVSLTFEDVRDMKNDVLITHEPTRAGIGWSIRKELCANNARAYSIAQTAQAFSIDRDILLKRLVLPALKEGLTIIQSRNVCSSLAYQREDAKDQINPLILPEILKLEGNKFALENAPNLLIISVLKDAEETIRRLKVREKQDNVVYDTLDFQSRISNHYQGNEIREIFQSNGTKVEYLDAGISIESSKQQAVDIFKKHYR
jgi:dTMP kinase